ncbi:MAG: recombinase RecA [Pseudomonadota bacterium]
MEGSRERALQAALGTIEKQYGKGAIMKLGSSDQIPSHVNTIPSGSLGLDIALGIGGYPRGRIVEIYGPEASGKTSLALHAVAQAQKAGGVALFIDAEHALDVRYAHRLGVDIDELLLHQPDSGEQALEVADTMIKSNALDIIVIDSVAALTPRAEIEGEMGDSHMGLQARLMSQAMRKLTGTVSKSRTLLMFINQIRMRIGVMFGNPETTTGGNALKFYSTIRIDIRRISTLKKADEVIGNRARAKVVKNKLFPPFREAEFDIIYGRGILRTGEVIDLAVKIGLIEKTGAWYSYGEERIGQGRDNAISFILENPDMYEDMEIRIKRKYGLIEEAGEADEADPAGETDPVGETVEAGEPD